MLGWAAVRALRTAPTPTPPPVAATVDEDSAGASDLDSTNESGSSAPSAAPARVRSNAAPVPRVTSSPRVASAPVSNSAAEQSLAVHEEFPDIPERAKRTIRGTVRVSVRVIVNEDGTVFAALSDDRGPSRYFERLAIEAAKKWTFIQADGSDQRVMLIRFAFSRDNDTANATLLR